MTSPTISSNRTGRPVWKSARLMLAAGIVVLAACPGTPTPPIIPPGPYTPGQSYFGNLKYTEYIAGNSPVILSAAHGGSLRPENIPDRNDATCKATAVTTGDMNTRDLVIAMQQAMHKRFGTFPHVVINHLHRSKLDANRPVQEASCGNSDAALAWLEFQAFLDTAKLAVVGASGKGWYMDMHGHAHQNQRLELGYLISAADLRRPDSTLDAAANFEDASSIKTVSKDETDETFSALLRGPNSLGALYVANKFPAVPSAADPFPQTNDEYFNGGYNTERHTCSLAAGPLGGQTDGKICGVQIEANNIGVRNSEENRNSFAQATAAILETYLATHWGIQLNTTVR